MKKGRGRKGGRREEKGEGRWDWGIDGEGGRERKRN